ncbi:MAG: DUF2848 domain-containing protein [Xanthobacter sp.]
MSGKTLTFTVHAGETTREETVAIRTFVIAGWTGRDKAAVEKHICELEELGIPRPATTPIYYRVAAARLTQDDAIEHTGGDSSGEVEYVVVQAGGQRYLGVASDHTDRVVETHGITISKQICDKPISRDLWLLDDVLDHWDQLKLRSWAIIEGARVLYQEGRVEAMLPPQEVLSGFTDAPLENGSAMLCGTLAAIGGIRPAERFEFELEDPVLGRTIRHAYDITVLPVAG